MGSINKVGLQWNDFEANIGRAFRDLKEEKDFSDVTLVCADQQVEAHKVILAASSPFFKKVLKKIQHTTFINSIVPHTSLEWLSRKILCPQ